MEISEMIPSPSSLTFLKMLEMLKSFSKTSWSLLLSQKIQQKFSLSKGLSTYLHIYERNMGRYGIVWITALKAGKKEMAHC